MYDCQRFLQLRHIQCDVHFLEFRAHTHVSQPVKHRCVHLESLRLGFATVVWPTLSAAQASTTEMFLCGTSSGRSWFTKDSTSCELVNLSTRTPYCVPIVCNGKEFREVTHFSTTPPKYAWSNANRELDGFAMSTLEPTVNGVELGVLARSYWRRAFCICSVTRRRLRDWGGVC